jgi:hypothetical protein
MLMEVRLGANQTQIKVTLFLNQHVMSLRVCYSSIKFSVFESFSRGTKCTIVVMQKHNLVLNIKKEGVIHVHKDEVRVNIFSV